MTSTRWASSSSRWACTSCRIRSGAAYRPTAPGQGHLVLPGRIPPPAQGGTDRGVQRRNLEAFPQMGRCAHGHHPERQGPAFLPRGGKHLRQQRFYLHAESGGEKTGRFSQPAQHLSASALLCHPFRRRRRADVLRRPDCALCDPFPRDTELYRLLTTKPGEVRKEEKA